MSGSTTTPLNQTFGVGRDISLVVITSLGVRLDLTGQVEFNHRPIYHAITHEPLNTPTRRRYLPSGHEFTITLERRGPANETLFSQIELGYWAGGYPNGTQDGGTLYVYENEVNGGVSIWLGTNVSLGMNDRMRAQQRSAIHQTIEGFASTFSLI
jgi:hypothetical protein